jgi:hypothetical protein
VSVYGWLTVGSCGRAAVGVIAKLVDMHATLSIGVIASDVPCDGGGGGLGILLESDGSGDVRVTSDGCNYNREKYTVSKDMEKVVGTIRAIRVLSEEVLVRNGFRLCPSRLRFASKICSNCL